jgi:hypothetical protein
MPVPTNNERAITQANQAMEVGGQWHDGIAIIGMSARFPCSRNVQEF